MTLIYGPYEYEYYNNCVTNTVHVLMSAFAMTPKLKFEGLTRGDELALKLKLVDQS